MLVFPSRSCGCDDVSVSSVVLYLLAKGNQFKNKRVLLEAIHELKAVHIKKSVSEQADARKGRAKSRLELRAAREAPKRMPIRPLSIKVGHSYIIKVCGNYYYSYLLVVLSECSTKYTPSCD
jgi:hypothetical protein